MRGSSVTYDPNYDDAEALARWEKATGGLPPELVAKALAYVQVQEHVRRDLAPNTYFTLDETAALRAATFEVPT